MSNVFSINYVLIGKTWNQKRKLHTLLLFLLFISYLAKFDFSTTRAQVHVKRSEQTKRMNSSWYLIWCVRSNSKRFCFEFVFVMHVYWCCFTVLTVNRFRCWECLPLVLVCGSMRAYIVWCSYHIVYTRDSHSECDNISVSVDYWKGLPTFI